MLQYHDDAAENVARRIVRIPLFASTKTSTTLLLFMFLFSVDATLVSAFVPVPPSCNSHHIISIIMQTRCKNHGLIYQKASSSAFDSSKESISSTASSVIKEEPEQEEQEGPDMKAYAAGYRTVFEEMPCRDCTTAAVIQGKVPDDLHGTYFRVGPAMFSAGSIVPPKKSILQPKQLPVPDGQDVNRMVRHPFEGDGAILAITFGSSSSSSDGNGSSDSKRDVTARFRFVRTTGFTNERRKGQKVYKAMEATRNMPLNSGSSSSSSNNSGSVGSIINDWYLPLYRHHLQAGLNKNRKNTSNTRAIYWGKRLLTLWQGGLPYKLDAIGLSTEGRSQLGGAIESEEDSLGCKMVVDAAQNRALFYGVSWPSPQKSQVVFYEFNEQFRLVEEEENEKKNGKKGRFSLDLPGFALLNDFTATCDYYILVQPNVVVADAMQYLISKDPSRVLKLQNDQSCVIHLIPRVGSNISNKRQMMSIPIPRGGDDNDDNGMDGNLQFINSYQEGDIVVVDAIRSSPTKGNAASKQQQQLATWPWVDSLDSYQAGTSLKSPWRYTVNTRTGSISKKPLLSSSARHESCSFGVIHPSYSTLPHRYIYMNVGRLKNEPSPPQGIARLDCTTGEMTSWMPARHEFCGEPMFAPPTTTSASNDSDNSNGARDDETRGYIISVLWNGKTKESQAVILNAQDVVAGPVARIPLGMAIPHGLFGCFTKSPEATWSLDAIDRRAKLDDKMESRGDMWNEVKSDFSGLGLRLDDMPEYFGDFFE
jgi:all-trans-8'-apo-beta-carotenal 15,15'-oxygenase